MTVGLFKFTKEYNLGSLTQYYLGILGIITFLENAIQQNTKKKKEDLLASTSIFLTRSYFFESGPNASNFQFYSLDSML